MKHQIFRLALIVVFCTSPMFATHGTRMVGFNAQSAGRGGASFGVYDSPSLMMTNPAGIAFLNSAAVDADFSLMVPTLHFTNTLNNQKGETNYFPIAALGYANPQHDADWSWGIGMFTQGGMGADFSLNHALFVDANGNHVPQEYHSKLAVMQGGPSFAYRLSPSLAIGASAHLMYSMLDFKMPYSLSPSVMRGVANPITGMTFGAMFSAPASSGGFGYNEVTALAAMNDLTAIGFGAKIGIAYKINDNISLGLSYTSPTSFTYKNGSAKMDMTAQMNDAFGKAVQGFMMQNPGATQGDAQAAIMQQFGQMGIDMMAGVAANYDLKAKLKFPQSIGIGTLVKASENVRLALDVEWVNWKNAFDNMTLTLSNGTSTNINTMLGNDGNLSIQFPMKWKDQVAVRFGGEYDVIPTLTLRAGFAYGSNPVPETTVFPVFPAIVESHMTFGAAYQLSNAFTINGAYEFALNKAETASSQSLLAQEYNNSISELQENIFHLSLAWVLQ